MSFVQCTRRGVQFTAIAQSTTSRKLPNCNHLHGEKQSSSSEVQSIASNAAAEQGGFMKRHQMSSFCLSSILSGLVIVVIFAAASASTAEEPTPAAVANFNAYVSAVESHLSLQHRSQ